jgi:uncharacterized integral membrane protein (TIGR00698 family)
MLLAPFLIALSAYLSRSKRGSQKRSVQVAEGSVVIPWFALGFVAVAGCNSLELLPVAFVSGALNIDTLILAMAMAALGVTTHVSAIRTAGLKPLALAALLFAWLIVGGYAINAGLFKLLTPARVSRHVNV